MQKVQIASDQVIAEYLASAVVELRRLGMHLDPSGDYCELSARLYTYAEMIQAILPLVESLEKKGRAML